LGLVETQDFTLILDSEEVTYWKHPPCFPKNASNRLILKDFRTDTRLYGICKNKKLNDLFALSLLAERANKEQRAGHGDQSRRPREKKKAALRPPRVIKIPEQYYQRIPYSVKKNANKGKNGAGKRRKSAMAGPSAAFLNFFRLLRSI
jgi:hypothetical protein